METVQRPQLEQLINHVAIIKTTTKLTQSMDLALKHHQRVKRSSAGTLALALTSKSTSTTDIRH